MEPRLTIAHVRRRVIMIGVPRFSPAHFRLPTVRPLVAPTRPRGRQVPSVNVLFVIKLLIPLYLIARLFFFGPEISQLQTLDIISQGADNAGVDVMRKTKLLGKDIRIILSAYENRRLCIVAQIDDHLYFTFEVQGAVLRLPRLIGLRKLVFILK